MARKQDYFNFMGIHLHYIVTTAQGQELFFFFFYLKKLHDCDSQIQKMISINIHPTQKKI